MTAIQQTVDIPPSRRLTIDVPREVPAGPVILTFTPAESPAKGQSNNEAFRQAIRRAYGAWGDNPREDGVVNVRSLREEWGCRDPWNSGPDLRRRD